MKKKNSKKMSEMPVTNKEYVLTFVRPLLFTCIILFECDIRSNEGHFDQRSFELFRNLEKKNPCELKIVHSKSDFIIGKILDRKFVVTESQSK